MRSLATPLLALTAVVPTRASVPLHFSLTPPAAPILPSVMQHLAAALVAATSHWAISPASISPRAIAILISATELLLPTTAPSASARQERRQPPISPASVGQQLQEVYQLSSMPAVISARSFPQRVSRTRLSPWTRQASLSWRLNRSPFATNRSLIPSASHSLASWPRKWKK